MNLRSRSGKKKQLTVKDCSGVDVGAELPLCVREQRFVQLGFFGAEIISANNDSARGQTQIIGPLDLSPTKHHTVKKNLEFLESDGARPKHPVLLNRCQNLVVPETRLFYEKPVRSKSEVRNSKPMVVHAASDCGHNLYVKAS